MAARKSRGNTTFTYNGQSLTAYMNQAELDATIDRIETTHFGSTGAESIAGDPTYTISGGGDWDNALDAILAPDAVTPGTKRTSAIGFIGSSATVTYTWTTNSEIQNYNVSSGVGDKIAWSAEFALSGAPTRTSA